MSIKGFTCSKPLCGWWGSFSLSSAEICGLVCTLLDKAPLQYLEVMRASLQTRTLGSRPKSLTVGSRRQPLELRDAHFSANSNSTSFLSLQSFPCFRFVFSFPLPAPVLCLPPFCVSAPHYIWWSRKAVDWLPQGPSGGLERWLWSIKSPGTSIQ